MKQLIQRQMVSSRDLPQVYTIPKSMLFRCAPAYIFVCTYSLSALLCGGYLLPNLKNKNWQPVQNGGHSQDSYSIFLQPVILSMTAMGFLPTPATGRNPGSRRLRKRWLGLKFQAENVRHTLQMAEVEAHLEQGAQDYQELMWQS